MNNPKKKAKELINKFFYAVDEQGFHSVNKFRAKQCALIAAENSRTEMVAIQNYERAIYYRDVKQEIRNL